MTNELVPVRLLQLLDGELEAPILTLVGAAATVLGDNEMPFFPAYTDHGVAHVGRVLKAIEKLIPENVWDEGRFGAADAGVIVGGALLHDLALHLREAGFVALVGGETPHEAPAWFREDHGSRPADLPWPELWASFQQEARHFGISQLELILGPGEGAVPAVAHEDRLRPEAWTVADRLLVGEFLRRHHARLSHEIALYGFPGAGSGVDGFPVLEETIPQLADAIGLVARSHGEPLRRMLEYLGYVAPGSKQPAGAFLVYHMCLLRIADYLQVDADRAPPLLLRLKAPLSPLSIDEWNKHGAVASVGWAHDDPLAIYIGVLPRHGLRTHLALADLFADMQREMDTSAAVLSEVYSAPGLSSLRLSRQRLLSNLDEPSLHERLPFLPRRAALHSDPDLFRLVIRDLYGNQPAVAGRELIQNAVDAVRARRALEARTGVTIDPGELRSLDADVVVTLEERDNGSWVLRVADRGIGMTPDVVVDYFLRAGASFGPTSVELEELSPGEAVRAMKAGRFGVGAFATFLLGPEARVRTRHAESSCGLSFRARIDEDLVQIDWADAPIGTEVTIPFDPGSLRFRRGEPRDVWSPQEFLSVIASFYRLRDPRVAFVIKHKGGEEDVAAVADVPSPTEALPDRWRHVDCDGFDAVLWRIPQNSEAGSVSSRVSGSVTHNGIVIREPAPDLRLSGGAYQWSDASLPETVLSPAVVVFDTRHRLGVALHRYSLVDPTVPFETQLLESIGDDIMARGFARGAGQHPLEITQGCSPVCSPDGWLPPLPALLSRYARGPLLVLWRFRRTYRSKPMDADAFLAFNDRASRDAFPHRVSVDAGRRSRTELPEVRAWGHTLEDVARAANGFAARLSAKPLATVVIRASMGGEVKGVDIPHVSHKAWRELHRGASDPALYLFGANAVDELVEGELAVAARLLLRTGDQSSVALSAFGVVDQGSQGQGFLAAPWARTICGEMPRDLEARRRLLNGLAETNTGLQAQVSQWDRLVR
jgi:hypothetical protein